jgi:GH15 family glucan-1,4-alpha-glucosidase
MKWMTEHQNGFGMNPEAIDAKNESIPFINPLMWANSEYVCAAYANKIKELR